MSEAPKTVRARPDLPDNWPRLLLMPLLVVLALVAGCGSTLAPVPTPSPTPTPTPTPTEPAGVIEFGLDYDPDTLTIIDKREQFRRTYPEIAWSATFSEPAGATTIELIVASVAAGGAEEVLVRVDTNVANPEFTIFANKVDLASIVGNKAGLYVMRYFRESTLLAEGEFELVN